MFVTFTKSHRKLNQDISSSNTIRSELAKDVSETEKDGVRREENYFMINLF